MRRIEGFSLMELSIIIIILGILSIESITHFIVLIKEARTASLIGTSASIRSVTALSIIKYTLENKPTATTVDMNGAQIAVYPGSGVPVGSYEGIGKALRLSPNQNENGFRVNYHDPKAIIFQPISGGNENCEIIYNSLTGEIQIKNSAC